jgi:hypothetical protein
MKIKILLFIVIFLVTRDIKASFFFIVRFSLNVISFFLDLMLELLFTLIFSFIKSFKNVDISFILYLLC